MLSNYLEKDKHADREMGQGDAETIHQRKNVNSQNIRKGVHLNSPEI